MSFTYLLMDDDLKEVVLLTQDPGEIIARGLDIFSRTKHDLSVAKLETHNSFLISNRSFEDFVIDWKKGQA